MSEESTEDARVPEVYSGSWKPRREGEVESKVTRLHGIDGKLGSWALRNAVHLRGCRPPLNDDRWIVLTSQKNDDGRYEAMKIL